MESSKIMMFPEMGANNGIDPNLLLALNNNGGFGGGNWIWILFLWLIWGANGWGGNNGFGGNGFLSNQISNDTGRELLMNAIHEAKHVQSHICSYYDIPENGEDAAYLIGYLVQRMYKMFSKIIRQYV